jgi:hypothetical protein
MKGDKGTVFDGFHGRLNEFIVIQQRNGKPVMCFYPQKKKVKWTENQEKHRKEFKRAVRYARNTLKFPERLAFYQSREHDGINAYNLAIADYLHPPVIASIDIRKARNQNDYLVRVKATDNILVTRVVLRLVDLSGRMEDAEMTRFRKSDLWLYRISAGKLSTIRMFTASAYDFTSNYASMDYTISPEESINRLPHG